MFGPQGHVFMSELTMSALQVLLSWLWPAIHQMTGYGAGTAP